MSGSCNPQAPVRGLKKCPNIVTRQAIRGLVGAELSVFQPVDATRTGADPEAPVTAFEQSNDVRTGQLRRVTSVEHAEVDAIEAHQAFLGA